MTHLHAARGAASWRVAAARRAAALEVGAETAAVWNMFAN